MTDTPKANVQFTPEQALQLFELQKRLETLHAEIRVAQASIDELSKTTEDRLKYKNYLEECVGTLQKENDALILSKESLKTEVESSNKQISDNLTTVTERHSHLAAREESMIEKERDYQVRISAVEQRESANEVEVKNTAEKRLEVEQAKSVLVKALEQIKWS